jgi:hypothetical protein
MVALLTAVFGDLLAGDGLGITECKRRLPFAFATAEMGPFPGVFIVDTGASSSVTFHPHLFRDSPDPAWHFGEIHATFTVGSGPLAYLDNIEILAFENEKRKSRILLVEKPAKSPLHSGVDGLLGLPEMQEMALRIDLEQQAVYKVDSPWPATAGAVNVKLERRPRGSIRVPITIASSVGLSAIVDTGCWPFMHMQPATLKFHERLGNAIPARRVTVSTATEVREAQTYILKSVTICGFEFRDVEVQESNFNAVGIGCLSHFDMVLDFPYNEMWLTPHANEWPKRVPPDASGLVLGFQDTNLLSLVRIQPDSAGSKSTLQVDDQILLFDGKEPKDLSMMEIHKRQTEAGTVLPLRVKRGDRVFDVQLPLGYSFEYPPKWPNKKNVLDEFGEFLENDAKSPTSEHTVPNK